MAQCLLKPNKGVVPRHTARPFNSVDNNSGVENKIQEIFDALIKEKMGTSNNASKKELLGLGLGLGQCVLLKHLCETENKVRIE